VALAAPTDEAWRALSNAAARGWHEDQRFTTAGARLENRAALDQAIASWTANFEPDALEDLLQRVGVPVHRVATSADIFGDPQLAARRHIAYLEHARLGMVPIETSRMRFSRTPATAAWCGPEIGQHNDYVLSEILQMTDPEITELVNDKTLE
jgi:crotonobetainyl-CoA:carnitine CoA-transferase CaiB-like acyl-CoA transferase